MGEVRMLFVRKFLLVVESWASAENFPGGVKLLHLPLSPFITFLRLNVARRSI